MKQTLYVFDFDDTLAHTDSMVNLKRRGQSIDLDSSRFASYVFEEGDQLDFSDFGRVNGKIIVAPMYILNKLQKMDKEIVIITARPPQAIPGIQKFFLDNNMFPPAIEATSGSSGKIGALKKYLDTGMFNRVVVYEDSEKNIETLRDVAEEYMTKYDAIHLGHDTTMRKLYEKNIMKLTRRQLRELIQESMGSIPFDPGRRINKPGIADDVYNQLIEPEVIEMSNNEPDNIFDKVINIAMNAQNAYSVETLNLDIENIFSREKDANDILSEFISEMAQRLSAQEIEFDDDRKQFFEQATEGAADLVDSMLGVSQDIPENKSTHLQLASDAADMLMDALQNLDLI